jgi:hypothetical protein
LNVQKQELNHLVLLGWQLDFLSIELTVYHQRKDGLKTADTAGLVPIFSVWNNDITTEKNAKLGWPELLLQ